MWIQHVRYCQDERGNEESNIRALFIADLCKTLGDLQDFGHHVVLDINANDDVKDGAVSAALAENGILEAVIKNNRGESVPATCARNTQGRPIDSI